jgi:hypothetical protein
MKKAKEQPVGIVITTGSIAVSNPRVKAYLWCEAEPSDLSRTEDGSHLVK